MSLSWRERAVVTLAPQQVALMRYPRIGKGRGKGESGEGKSVDCTSVPGAPAWRGALEGLREILAHPGIKKADTDIVLSNHFVRYLLLPWNPQLAGEREEAAFAAARYQQVYGEAARGWSVRISPASHGMPTLAAAVEHAFLNAIAALLENSPLRLRSVQPALMRACNAHAGGVAPNAWIVLAEPGRLLLGLQREGHWRSLRSRPLNGEMLSLTELIEQEWLLLGMEPAGEKIYMHRSGKPPIELAGLELAGLKVEQWATTGGGVH